MIQPRVDFEFEVSFYFVDRVFHYALHAPDRARRWDLQPYAVTVDFDGVPVRTVSLEGLLKTKQRSPREKDAADRAVLERALREP